MERPKFAVVREDPRLELRLVAAARERLGRPVRTLLVASGGCTALTIAADHPDGEVTAFDLAPAQLAHAQRKRDAVLAGDVASLGAHVDDPGTLLQRGFFEGLFRTLRRVVEELVAPPDEIRRFFAEASGEARAALLARWTASPYWPVAFELALHESLLHAMFGPDATRHAERGSYPGYFQRRFEGALRREDAPHNPFLQHVFLGKYLPGDEPAYLAAKAFGPVRWVHGTLLDVPELARHDVVSLSNVFDWSDDALVARWAGALTAVAPGTPVLLRFLNNRRSVRAAFEPAFAFDDELGARLLAEDRSFFYDRIEVAVRAR